MYHIKPEYTIDGFPSLERILDAENLRCERYRPYKLYGTSEKEIIHFMWDTIDKGLISQRDFYILKSDITGDRFALALKIRGVEIYCDREKVDEIFLELSKEIISRSNVIEIPPNYGTYRYSEKEYRFCDSDLNFEKLKEKCY